MKDAVFKVLLGLMSIVAAASAMAQPGSPAADIVLHGVLHSEDKGSYRELPFTVPAGVEKIDVDIRWEGREQGTILVTGLYDPQRLRGWGGGIKPHFVVADGFASPSFLPGPIPSGIWRLTLAVASIRPGSVSPYSARIRFSRGAAAQVVTDTPVRPGPGWYRGDLHTHSGQSDAACRSKAGVAIRCPLFLTIQAAVAHGLDFVVITDPNASSQVAELPELAPYSTRFSLSPGAK
ncbi:hypothetical protein ACSBM8_13940 [Sphingomonas sp. ASY06-1R]|jgi:hypothetical protein|uniref:hypothetical protein n=1 Tax=Sphingomonas sp. ASY06-1R TaxID=3445771 RepID=UPI003FA32BFA